jgi:hypothetical protein
MSPADAPCPAARFAALCLGAFDRAACAVARHQEVGGGHQGLELALQPKRTVVMLAVRTGAVAAGVRQAALAVATLTRGQHLSRKAAAAALECGQGLSLAGQHLLPMALQQLGLKLCDQVGQAHHGWPPVGVDVDVDDGDVQAMV